MILTKPLRTIPNYYLLQFTAKNGHSEIVKILASLTEDPNVLNIYGDTPIQIEMEKPQLMWQQSVAIQKLSNLLNIFKLLKDAMLGHHQ